MQINHDDYIIALLCALPSEMAAARNMLDDLHVKPPQSESDSNIYTLGSMKDHSVVIVCQGGMGQVDTGTVGTRLVEHFSKAAIRLAGRNRRWRAGLS